MVKLKRNICIVVYNVFDKGVCNVLKFTSSFLQFKFFEMKRTLNVIGDKFVV